MKIKLLNLTLLIVTFLFSIYLINRYVHINSEIIKNETYNFYLNDKKIYGSIDYSADIYNQKKIRQELDKYFEELNKSKNIYDKSEDKVLLIKTIENKVNHLAMGNKVNKVYLLEQFNEKENDTENIEIRE